MELMGNIETAFESAEILHSETLRVAAYIGDTGQQQEAAYLLLISATPDTCYVYPVAKRDGAIFMRRVIDGEWKEQAEYMAASYTQTAVTDLPPAVADSLGRIAGILLQEKKR